MIHAPILPRRPRSRGSTLARSLAYHVSGAVESFEITLRRCASYVKCQQEGPVWAGANRDHGGADHRAVTRGGVVQPPDPASRPAGCTAPVADRGLRAPGRPGRRPCPGRPVRSGRRTSAFAGRKARQAGEELLRVAAALAVTGSRSAVTVTRARARLERDRPAGYEVVYFTWPEITRAPAQVVDAVPHYDQPDPMKDAAFTGSPPADPPPRMRPAGPRARPGSAGRPGARFKIAR